VFVFVFVFRKNRSNNKITSITTISAKISTFLEIRGRNYVQTTAGNFIEQL
jgi:hypothetical protein